MKRASFVSLAVLLAANPACSTDVDESSGEPRSPDDGTGDSDGGETGAPPPDGGSGGSDDPPRDGDDDSSEALVVPVALVPQAGAFGDERINFGVPLSRGRLDDPGLIRVEADGVELPAYVRPFAFYPDGSIRSVQIQIDVDIDAVTSVDVVVGAEAEAGSIEPVAVPDTLVSRDGTDGPRVWALFDPAYLAGTGLVGPVPASSPEAGATLGAWSGVCNDDRYDTSRFLSDSGSRGAWLYDRPTAMYRLHAITGELSPLRSAYREAHIYRSRISGSGSATRIGVPTAASDVKYHYTQGMAITYLLSGDERLRERVEDVATRTSDLWRPAYVPGGRFWTERHAGFALLAYVWAARVSHDRRDDFIALADEAVDAYRDMQLTYPIGYTDPDARCFSKESASAGESYGYEGCSPWLSAILADGLEDYAAERGGERAELARDSIVMLGRMLARDGVDPDGKPYYWLAGDGSRGVRDAYDEHYGEMPYVIAMAWHHDGRRDDSMRDVAEELIDNLAARGVAPHTRSFNWQCRGAPLAPLYLD